MAFSHPSTIFSSNIIQNYYNFDRVIHHQYDHYRSTSFKHGLPIYHNYYTQHSKIRHKPSKVTVIGAGSWGTAISKIIAINTIKYPDLFDNQVILYVRDENLRLMIEKTRVNIKYLIKIKLPMNVKPMSNLNEAISKSNILIFAIPHEYIQNICSNINLNSIQNNGTFGISLVKGFHIDSESNLIRASQMIEKMLKIPVGVLSGANVALDVAQEQFSEATLSLPFSVENKENLLKNLFQNDYFRVSFCDDKPTVEICGALKNVIACGAGVIDGLEFGVNTKAAIIRRGIHEAIQFTRLFHPQCQISTFLENCGIADIIASSFGGRNRKVFEVFVKNKKPLAELEKEILCGQKLQGPNTAKVVYKLLKHRKILHQFPLFTAIHKICESQIEPKAIINSLKQCL